MVSMMPIGRLKASPVTGMPLAPPWATVVAVAALMVGILLAAVVWHATRLSAVDAWVLRWQELALTRAGGVASIVSATLTPVVVLTMVTGAVLGWRVQRWDLTLFALAALPTTYAVEVLLKRLVHRQWEGDPALIFPSGHAAMATAVALTAVLAVRVTRGAPRIRMIVVCLTVGYVVAIAVARLIETVHAVTDVLGGVATGLVVTLGVALALTAMFGYGRPDRAGSASDR
jgi:membrane-associated phospholipid phosphatase